MEKYLIRKSSNDSNEGQNCSLISETNKTNVNKIKNLKRKYNEEYLKFGFIAIEENDCQKPFCVVCRTKFENNALFPAKLKRHLETIHKDLAEKPIDYFQRKRDQYLNEIQVIKKSLKINDKALQASYVISLQIAKCKKPHNIGEELILPAIIETCKLFFGEEKSKIIETIPLSNDTVKRRFHDMSQDIENQLIKRINGSNGFALQIDESMDIKKSSFISIY